MNRERRSSLAIGVAVFIAGGVLLGLEIASSRVLAPFFGNSFYVWGSLIGIVLAGLSTGYWLGGIVADRYPTPRLLVGAARCRRAARARDPVRRRLDPGPRRRLGSRPAAEPRDRHHPPLRPAEPRPRQRVAGRRAPEGSLDREPRPHGRTALRHLDGGLYRRHVPDLVLADPRARHRPGAGVGRGCAGPGGRRGCAGREARRLRSRSPSRSPVRALERSSRSRPTRAGRLPPRSFGTGRRCTGSGLSKIAPAGSRSRRAATRSSHTKDSQYHRIAVVRGRREPLPPLRQLVSERDVPRRPVPDALRVLRLSPAVLRLPSADAPDPLRRPRRRLGAQADLARLPRRADRRRRARPGGRRHRLQVLRAASRSPAGRRRSRTVAATSPATRAPGT